MAININPRYIKFFYVQYRDRFFVMMSVIAIFTTFYFAYLWIDLFKTKDIEKIELMNRVRISDSAQVEYRLVAAKRAQLLETSEMVREQLVLELRTLKTKRK